MPKQETPEPSTRSPEMIDISVTVVDRSPPSGVRLRARLAEISRPHRPRNALALAVVLIALGAIVMTAVSGTRTPRLSGARRSYPVQRADPVAIRGAPGYPYPLFCLSITTLANGARYAPGDVELSTGCGRFDRYVDTSLRRADGTRRGRG
ncbi:MAG TPA: hypothetical protein VGH93_03010 [Solirubrobacteraceae bacterium]